MALENELQERRETKVRYTKTQMKNAVLDSPFGKVALYRFNTAKEKSNLRYDDIVQRTGITRSDLAKYMSGQIILAEHEFNALEKLFGLKHGSLNPFKLFDVGDVDMYSLSRYFSTDMLLATLDIDVKIDESNEKLLELAIKFQKELTNLIRGY